MLMPGEAVGAVAAGQPGRVAGGAFFGVVSILLVKQDDCLGPPVGPVYHFLGSPTKIDSSPEKRLPLF